ncbi:MAG TPA: DJ-1/PfpI family protein [Alphaproteobacteria bacterium]|nr:DJ-1/PfpI family protein [Alphaproteobacteria bacterium]HQS94005.1 DJ-1/PfpI family protein [Alphaproteobacteria bacterium]
MIGCSDILAFITRIYKTTQITASVCTGSLFLSKLRLLEGLKYTTHWEDLEALAQNPNLLVLKDAGFVENGKYITSGGIASGISMSLYLVKKILS